MFALGSVGIAGGLYAMITTGASWAFQIAIAAVMCNTFSVPLSGLVLLPTDRRNIKRFAGMGTAVVSTAITPACGVVAIIMLSNVSSRATANDTAVCNSTLPGGENTIAFPCWHFLPIGLYMVFVAVLSLAVSAKMVISAFVYTLPTRALLDLIFWVIGMYFFAAGAGMAMWYLVCLTGDARIFGDLYLASEAYVSAGAVLCALAMMIMGYSVSRPQFRARTQGWLVSRSAHTSRAAGVAALLGGYSIDEVQKTAREKLRCVTLDRISREHMATNKPDASLYALSQPARLGSVDAFISHSWHDNAPRKWAALQAWRSEFKAAHGGREPRCWIDKCCIDQRDIEANLMCLPVFLAGCNRLLVLCGDTYLQRLWCTMELFVFLEMGAQPHQIDLRSLAPDDTAAARMREAFEAFDILDASCFLPEDKEHLLSIVESSFSSFEQFNVAVRSMLRLALTAQAAQQDRRAGSGSVIKRVFSSSSSSKGADADLLATEIQKAVHKALAAHRATTADLEAKLDRVLSLLEEGRGSQAAGKHNT